MTAPLRLQVKLREDRVEQIKIQSPRLDAGAIFVGRTPAEAQKLAGQIFSLCPVAQSLALSLACDAAQNLMPDVAMQKQRLLALRAERLSEMLRASFLDWPGEPPPPEDFLALRDALNILRHAPQDEHLGGTLEKLGLFDGSKIFARQQVEIVENFDSKNFDPLTPADDEAIGAKLGADPQFALAPALESRCPETGASARQGGVLGQGGGVRERLEARRADMIANFELLSGVEPSARAAEPPERELVGFIQQNKAFGVVDSARGRLYHHVEIIEGRIKTARILAPTEWNFSAAGPFVSAARGAKISGDPQQALARLAFVFDPCLRAQVEIMGADHA